MAYRYYYYSFILFVCLFVCLFTEAPDYFIELMNDKNIPVAKLSSAVVTCMAVSLLLCKTTDMVGFVYPYGVFL